jgi:hypothetical protein
MTYALHFLPEVEGDVIGDYVCSAPYSSPLTPFPRRIDPFDLKRYNPPIIPPAWAVPAVFNFFTRSHPPDGEKETRDLPWFVHSLSRLKNKSGPIFVLPSISYEGRGLSIVNVLMQDLPHSVFRAAVGDGDRTD